jgi:hypothetical protein
MDETAPKLDARSRDDVIAQTEALAIAYTTGLTPGPWRPRSGGTLDFGGVLVRLFAGMVDHLIAQLNRAPDKHRAAFTALFGARRIPPRPARVPVTFTRADRSGGVAEVPAGAQVAATGPDGPVVFETELALALTQARLAAAVVRDVSDPGGYAIQTDIATGGAAGSFAALGGGQPIEHFLYVAVDELAAVAGAGTVTLTLDAQGAALPSTPIVWARAAPGGGWTQLPPVTVAGSKWIQTAAASALGTITVSGVKARWLRATVPAGSPSVTITGAVGFNVATATQVDAAAVNGQQADFTRDVQPFGDRPQFNDTFFIASDAAFAVAGTTVTIAFAFTMPPGGMNTSSDLKLQWEAWDGVHATLLGTTTKSGAGTDVLTTDSTRAFTLAGGNVVFTLPVAIPRSTIGPVTSRWLRVRLIAGDYGKDVQVGAGGVVTPATFSPPSISSMSLTWTGTTPARPTSLVVRQTAQTYKFFRGADAAGSLPIFLAAPELSYQSAVETRSSLMLGFDRAFEPVLTTLYLQVFPPASPDPALFGTAPTPRKPPVVVWEYWNGNAWLALVVEDGTLNLSRSGLVRFEPPVDAARLTQFGRKLFWLRARAFDLAFSPMPQVGRVLVNTVWASNARISTLEVIGSSNGARDQRFTLAQRPVLDGQRIEVGEPEPPPAAELAAVQAEEGDDVLTPDLGVTWVRWHEVPDFYGSAPRDRHYTFDAETGEVAFGDGAAGMIPPTGVQNIRAASYRAGGGTAGNVAAGALNQLQTTVALVDSVTNTEPAVGGAAIEPEAALLDRAARTVRHGGRAVAAQDFSDLARESSRAVARAVTLTPSFSPISEANGPLVGPADLDRDGQVIVVIVPSQVQAGASPSSELCAEVEDYLRARCAPDARVMVIGPSWVATDLAIRVAATSLERTDDMIAAVREAVIQLLDPLTGGAGGTGWDFGRCPRASDFVARLAAIPDIDHVSSITVTCDPPFKDTDPATELLVDELSLYPRLLAYARTITVTASPLGVP